MRGAELGDTDLSTAQFDSATGFDGAELGKAKFYQAGDKTEEARGLSPDQVLRSKDWIDAIFSPSFREKMLSPASASAANQVEGLSPG